LLQLIAHHFAELETSERGTHRSYGRMHLSADRVERR
jgi:hypothetical protein